jgi:serine/threonine protein kinase
VEPLKPSDPSQLGDWSITGRLGEGEDSVIYLGVKGIAGSEQAAIKLIEDDSFEFESALSKIKNEVEALKQLDNENIVKLLDARYEPGNLWIATEYIHGLTLDTKLKQTREPLEELHWFRVAENIFHALEAAHAKGIIHKDIKPSNIILSESGAKLIDFGISHVPEKTRTAIPGDFEGSRLFSAPENYNRKNIEEMDVFSAGVTLAYAAKLKSVWAGDNQDAITESIKNDKPDLTGITQLQEEFIRPLLEKLPIDRPSSASVHKKALEYIEYLVDKEHRKKPVALRVKKTLSRRLKNPWVKWGLPVALVGSAALLFTSPWSAEQKLPSVLDMGEPRPSASASQTPRTTSPTPISTLENSGLSEEGQKAASTCIQLSSEFKIAEANKACLIAANEGDAASMLSLGYNFYETLKDTKQGLFWYKKSAEKGYAVAMYNLGTLYMKTNPAEAEKWFSKCSDSNYALCSYNYGVLLQNSGRTLEAKIAYEKGLKLKNSGSAYNLGTIYRQERNWTKAKEVFTVGANLDDYMSSYALGSVYQVNYADLDSACTWYYKSLKLKKDYLLARTAVIEVCKNRKFEIAPDVQVSKGPMAPYQASGTGSDYKAGDWVLLLKTDKVDASSASGIQYKIRGTNNPWQYTFYGTYRNSAGVYTYIPERENLQGACLDFRLVRESRDGYIIQIWEMLPSICQSN